MRSVCCNPLLTLIVWVATAAGVVDARTTDAGDDGSSREVVVDNAEQLAQVFAEPVESVHVRLEAGRYELSATNYTDPTCGNCQDPDTPTETTVGLHVRGRDIRITGPDEGDAVIVTNAGYGLLIEGAANVRLERITITGGVRSTDGNATDGAVVVRRADVELTECVIRDNIGDEEIVRETVSGVMGVVGREDAEITIDKCRILRNSWDGIALYRGAKAMIEDTIVDGVDAATGSTIAGGRGVGIGVTWNAQATVRGCLVRNYWKGLGIFVDAQVTAEENIIEDIVTWGIALWDAGDGQPVGNMRRNAVFDTGACGVSLAAGESDANAGPGELRGIIVVNAGRGEQYDDPDRYCMQCAISKLRTPDGFVIDDAFLHDNRRVDCSDAMDDLTADAFHERAAPLLRALSQRRVLRGESRFLREFAGDQ